MLRMGSFNKLCNYNDSYWSVSVSWMSTRRPNYKLSMSTLLIKRRVWVISVSTDKIYKRYSSFWSNWWSICIGTWGLFSVDWVSFATAENRAMRAAMSSEYPYCFTCYGHNLNTSASAPSRSFMILWSESQKTIATYKDCAMSFCSLISSSRAQNTKSTLSRQSAALN